MIKLPEPAEYVWQPDGTFDIGQERQLSPNTGPCNGWNVYPIYTESQMRQAIRDALEEAEKAAWDSRTMNNGACCRSVLLRSLDAIPQTEGGSMIEQAKAVAQRLREVNMYGGTIDFHKIVDTIDALVQEVERLQKEVDKFSYTLIAAANQKLRTEVNSLRAEIERLKAKEERYTLVDTALKNEVEEMRQEVERLKQACDKFSESEMLLKQEQSEPDSTCSDTLRLQGKPYPRTCKKCGLGPCIGGRAAAPKQEQAEPVAYRWKESNWLGWETNWEWHDRAKDMGCPIEYAYTAPQGQNELLKQALEALENSQFTDEYRNYGLQSDAITAIKQHLEEK